MSDLFTKYSDDEIAYIKSLTPKNIDTLDKAMQKLVNMKQRIHIFDDINVDELEKIVENVNFRRYKNKEYVIREGESSKELFILLKGSCQVVINKHPIGLLGTGQVFGEVAAVFGTMRNASVVSISDNTLVLSCTLKDNAIVSLPYATAILYRNLAKQINQKLEIQNRMLSKTV